MYTIRPTTTVSAPPLRCFDLARGVETHVRSAGDIDETAVGARTTGLLDIGDEITFRGRHFGIVLELTSRITAVDRPNHFQDRMIRGAFRFSEHDDYFESADDRTTVMIAVLRFAAPFWPIGWVMERLLLGPDLRQFLVGRNAVLKKLAVDDPVPSRGTGLTLQ